MEWSLTVTINDVGHNDAVLVGVPRYGVQTHIYLQYSTMDGVFDYNVCTHTVAYEQVDYASYFPKKGCAKIRRQKTMLSVI